MKPLKGAVDDAKSMTEYLRELSIPREHITEIYNEQATRSAIKEGFQRLAVDKRIKRGDAILIFYAGHGCETEAPPGWETDNHKIQGLVPFDVKTQDKNGQVIELLPDRTVASLLDDIADKKGDNITVIFDCCHSTGGTRGESSEVIARCVDSKDLPPLSSNVDEAILGQTSALGRSSAIPTGFAHRALRSHVLLAACGSNEVAWERDGKGEFTNALLSVLRGSDLAKLTYKELMDSLPAMPRQNPQCEGLHNSRIIFEGKLAGASPSMTKVKVDGSTLRLQAGVAQGVTQGARFEVYQHHLMDPSNPCLAVLEVTAAETFHSILDWSHALRGLRNPAYARQVRAGLGHHIKVYVSQALKTELKGDPAWRDGFLVQDTCSVARSTCTRSEADLSLDVTANKQVIFTTHNKLVNQHGITQLPCIIPLDGKLVLDVLRSAAAWDWHVRRTNPNPPFGDNVRIEMFKVKQDFTVWNEVGQRPIIQESKNMNTSGVVTIAVDPEELYGYRLVNDSSVDLYPYLFYFDASKLSIEHYYLGPIPGAGKIDVPLPRKGSLSVGYGASGETPFAYSLEDGQALDIGIIKLFIATSPVNFGLIEQDSPFDEGGRGSQRRVIVESRLANIELWDTQMMVLVQKSHDLMAGKKRATREDSLPSTSDDEREKRR
ncbi:ICE-like protease (caspase) p20 domain protein [Ceratobasidium sp. AG-Ba]|nr:ICE-like protease (caspase) p20 domain protein [Ceratobasidium sp. AG-Ba]